MYPGASAGPLNYSIRYTSRPVASLYQPKNSLGQYWFSSYDRRLNTNPGGSAPAAVVAVRPTGQALSFAKPSSGTTYLPEADIGHRLSRLVDAGGATTGWRLVTEDSGESETYDVLGTLLSIVDRAGRVQTLHYDSMGRLVDVTDDFGRQLKFGYDKQNRISTLTQPDNGVVHFAYDAANNLSGITWPDQKVRTFVYDDPRFPNHLTGIIDENGIRYATWAYDASGRATSSEHNGGAERVILTFNSGNTDVKDALNRTKTYGLTTVLSVTKGTGVSQPAGAGVAASSSSASYDANGNVTSRTDFNGNQTCYAYDLARNLETKRVEGLPAAAVCATELSSPRAPTAANPVRSVSTQWHGYWRLPVKVAEPKKVTTYVYNGDGGVYCAPTSATVPTLTGGTQPIGVLCQQTEQATTDASGAQGFSAAVTGSPRTWTWTYNASGQVLTADGPRTDVADQTQYTYYEATDPDLGKRGNLATVQNALNQLTQITAYDADGRPLTIVDPNGVATQLTYYPRGWLKSRQVGNELTSYSYDGVGQLQQVTFPDQSFLKYTYDGAHRLTDIEDAVGNTIHYTPDVMSNRTKEEVKDPAGQLARKRRWEYDALNRLWHDISCIKDPVACQITIATTYEYDANGNRTKVTLPGDSTLVPPLGARSTISAYDALNRLIQVNDPGDGSGNGKPTKYGYDGQDRLAQVTDPRNLATSYTVDGLGNRLQLHSPDTGDTLSTFDEAGNEKTRKDALLQTTTTVYDALNRPTVVTYQDGASVTYLWDLDSTQVRNGIGRLGRIEERNAGSLVVASLKYDYDPQGRIAGETRTVGSVTHAIGYAYTGGQLTGLTYPSGRVLTYTRDAAGRISQVSLTEPGQAPKVLAQNIAYQPFGGVKGYTDGAGQSHTRGYDLDGRVSSFSLGGTAPWVVSYDAPGRITGVLDGGNASNSGTFGYDVLDRLTNATLPGNTAYGYAYDDSGNRTARTGSVSGSSTIDAASNRMNTAPAPSRTYQYDANGSIKGDGTNLFGYDARGRLIQATTAAGATQYQINALGQRVRKTNATAGVDVVYHYDTAGRLLAESGPDGKIQREYLWLDDLPLAVLQ